MLPGIQNFFLIAERLRVLIDNKENPLLLFFAYTFSVNVYPEGSAGFVRSGVVMDISPVLYGTLFLGSPSWFLRRSLTSSRCSFASSSSVAIYTSGATRTFFSRFSGVVLAIGLLSLSTLFNRHHLPVHCYAFKPSSLIFFYYPFFSFFIPYAVKKR